MYNVFIYKDALHMNRVRSNICRTLVHNLVLTLTDSSQTLKLPSYEMWIEPDR